MSTSTTPSNVTHAIIYCDPSILLRLGRAANREKDTDDYLRARYAAVLNDGQSVITTMEAYIPQPPIGGDRQICLRGDFRYGDDDHTIYPQPLHPSLPHLPCLRTFKDEETHSLLFALPSEASFEKLDLDGYTGLGRINGGLIQKFIQFALHCQKRDTEVRQDGKCKFLRDEHEGYYLSVIRDAQSFIYRLSGLPSTFSRILKTIRHLQRALLEWDAWICYWDVFLPRIQGTVAPATESDSRAKGAFVFSANAAETMQMAGLAFWLIRPFEQVLGVPIGDIAPLLSPIEQGIVIDLNRDNRIIYTGAANEIRRYESICNAGRALFSFPDPFSTVAAPTPVVSTSSGSQSQGSIRALNRHERNARTSSPYSRLIKKPNTHGTRSKFDHPSHPWYPEAIPSWRGALASVDTSSDNFLFEKINTDYCYAFPEPAKLVSATAEGKNKSIINSWVKYRSQLLHAMSDLTFNVQPQPPKAWDALLTAEYVSSNNQDREHKRTKLRNDMLAILGHTDLEKIDKLSLSTADAHWEGKPVAELNAIDYQRILWELAELNFRFEFQALDTRLTLGGPHEREIGRSSRIRQCLPGGLLLVVNWRTANHGIASHDTRERAHYFFLMADLMKDWRGGIDPDGTIAQIRSKLKWTEEEIDTLENEITKTYTQMYFNSFQRAPIVPLRLSSNAMISNPSYKPMRAPVMDNQRHIIINTLATGQSSSLNEILINFELFNSCGI